MDTEGIEDICNEYKAKPYKIFKDLPSFFGQILTETDKWLPLPFEPNERFIDFSRGLQSQGAVHDNFDSSIHLNETYNGFVTLNRENKIPQAPWFVPTTAYILEGKFRYAQEEYMHDEDFTGKSQIFIKNGTTLEVTANQFETEAENESTIGNIARIMNKDMAEKDYFVTVIQYPKAINLNINRKDLTNPSSLESRTNPFIELKFYEEHDVILHHLQNDEGMLKSLISLSDRFGMKYISPNSYFFDALANKYDFKVGRRENSLVLNDVISVVDILFPKR